MIVRFEDFVEGEHWRVAHVEMNVLENPICYAYCESVESPAVIKAYWDSLL